MAIFVVENRYKATKSDIFEIKGFTRSRIYLFLVTCCCNYWEFCSISS